jgi:hypothetical protein
MEDSNVRVTDHFVAYLDPDGNVTVFKPIFSHFSSYKVWDQAKWHWRASRIEADGERLAIITDQQKLMVIDGDDSHPDLVEVASQADRVALADKRIVFSWNGYVKLLQGPVSKSMTPILEWDPFAKDKDGHAIDKARAVSIAADSRRIALLTQRDALYAKDDGAADPTYKHLANDVQYVTLTSMPAPQSGDHEQRVVIVRDIATGDVAYYKVFLYEGALPSDPNFVIEWDPVVQTHPPKELEVQEAHAAGKRLIVRTAQGEVYAKDDGQPTGKRNWYRLNSPDRGTPHSAAPTSVGLSQKMIVLEYDGILFAYRGELMNDPPWTKLTA